MTTRTVTITPVPFPAMQEALRAGKVDVGEFPQPFAALLEEQANVRKIFGAKYGVPFDDELIVLAGRDDFLKKHAARSAPYSKTSRHNAILSRPSEGSAPNSV